MLRREALYLGHGAGQRFALLTHPAREVRGAVLHVHAFAEELNRSRRMVALAAREFAEQGWLVMQVDAHGCGDSAGDFKDASWDSWQADIDMAHHELRQRTAGPIWLWTLRAGSLLASDWLATRQLDLPLLCWQPVWSGKQFLTQFLRIAASTQSSAKPSADADVPLGLAEMRSRLQSGQAVPVAGYVLPSAVAQGLEQSELKLPDAYRSSAMLIEVDSTPGSHASPPMSGTLTAQAQKWSQQGIRAQALSVSGPKFWQSPEIALAPQLLPPSIQALSA